MTWGHFWGAAWLGAGLLGMAGCGQPQRPPAPAPVAVIAPAPPPPPAPAPAAARPAYTLILTWLVANEPPATTQTSFHDAAACEAARAGAIAEGRRLASDAAATFAAASAKYVTGDRRFVGSTPLGAGGPAPTLQAVPTVTAFCASGS